MNYIHLPVAFGPTGILLLLPATWSLLGSVALVLLSVIYIRSRFKALKDEKSDLHRQVHERSELLEYAIEREKKLRENTSQVNRSKSLLLARINHEIRTPLNGMLGMTSLLAETSLTTEQREYNDTIRECGDSLLKIVNDILLKDLLDYAKVESGKIDLEQKPLDLENTLEEVWDIFATRAAENGLELVYEIDPDVPHQVVGDSARLKQVLMNLVENSIRFTQKGTVLVKVHTVSTGQPNILDLVFEIKDTGSGIAPSQLKLLLAGMESTNTTGFSNAGVGLIISRKLVEFMGGQINIESQPGKGTSVVFSIRTSASLQSSRFHTHENLSVIAGKKILVVEDNLTHVNFIRAQLDQWEAQPIIVHSGEDALKTLASTPDITLLITDNQVLDMTGLELAQMAKATYPHLPIIYLAPTGDMVAKQNSHLFSEIIAKPVKKHLLSRQIISSIRHQGRLVSIDKGMDHKLSSAFSNAFPLRILVAEDNETNQKLAMKILGKLGYNPDIARNGKEVLDIVSDKNYDLILMDVQMPVMDGIEATRMIRLCLNVQPVIVAMTANTLQGDREACLQAGMDDYISKPINLEELVNILEKWAVHLKEKA
ncbi:MAG TPA: response regulator [Ohtaekwangia sp.]|nr:response regulator [Ohtaekwangia sp.]